MLYITSPHLGAGEMERRACWAKPLSGKRYMLRKRGCGRKSHMRNRCLDSGQQEWNLDTGIEIVL